MELHALHIEGGIPEQQYLHLLLSTDADMRKRISSFYRREDAERSLAGIFLAKTVIADRIGQPVRRIQFQVNPYGKPEVSGLNIHFNISHSGDWVICALDEQPIGTDIEQCHSLPPAIGDLCFTEEEKAYLAADSHEYPNRFYKLWTLKESYIKALGKGMSIPLQSFSIQKSQEESRFKCYIQNHLLEDWSFETFNDITGYQCAVCCHPKSIPGQLKLWSLNDFYYPKLELA